MCINDMNAESDLQKMLLDNYDEWNPNRNIRPVRNETDTTKLKFGLALIFFLGYDEERDIATFSMWERKVGKQ